jgi:protein-tyrosine-phosphatase
VIVGAEPRIIVPVARSLHRQGVRCIIAVPPRESFSIRSRTIADVVQLHGTLAEASSFLGLLADAQDAAWIAPASDDGLAIIAHGYSWLSRICAVGCPEPDAVARVLDWPRAGAAAQVATCVAMLMVDDAAAAVFQYRLERRGDDDARAVAVSEPADPDLVERSVTLLSQLRWKGVATIEFIRQEPGSAPEVARVTGRFWDTIALPIDLGVDFPRYAWEASQSRSPAPPSSYVIGATSGTATLWSASDPLPALQQATASVLQPVARWLAHTTLGAAVQRLLHEFRVAQYLPDDRRSRYLGIRLRRLLGRPLKQRLPTPVRSVLFVCHANIVRSAAAAEFLREALRASGSSNVQVASAGTTTRDGCQADPRVQRAALALGASLAHHRSQRLTQELVSQSDVIFAMDDMNFVNIETDFPQSRAKLRMLGGMNSSGAWDGTEIVDPYSGTDAEVASRVAEIHHFVTELHAALTRNNEQG